MLKRLIENKDGKKIFTLINVLSFFYQLVNDDGDGGFRGGGASNVIFNATMIQGK